jgi:Protein kinase domain
MSERLGLGSTFAGCRLEAIAGRGGMGVVYRATQLALSRPVALKVIAPDWAADEGYRERFQRESQLTASIDHPNVIPVYEAGELDGRLYLVMRWVDGTDLRTVLSSSGRLPPGLTIELLRPVASALAAAHRRGLVHRDIEPANVLIARGGEGSEDHIYLTDFGIARRSDGESITRTGMLVGTVDYMAPERFEGDKGGAASDIYSFGCMLFELVTGHVPFDRPNSVAKVFAHVSDPIPSPSDEVAGIPERLDAVIATAMAKRPEDRFGSTGKLVAALDEILRELDTAERDAVAPPARPDATAASPPTATTEPLTAGEPETIPSVTEPRATGPRATEPQATQAATVPIAPTAPSPIRRDARRDAEPARRRPRIVWLAPIVLLAVAGILIAVLTGGSSNGGRAPGPAAGSTQARVNIQGSGLSRGWTIGVPGAPGSISIGSRNVWISLPDRAELVRFNPHTGRRRVFPADGGPTAIAAGFSALWVAETASRALAQYNGDSGDRVRITALSGTPTAVAVDSKDSSAWVADSSGAVSHVALGGGVIGSPSRLLPAATSIAWGEGWLWATNGASNGLIRVSLGIAGSSTAYDAGPQPVAVALDQGVWTAHATGHVTRFNPLPDHLRINADITLPAELDSIAATEQGRYVWAISRRAKQLYRTTNTSTPTVTGTVTFASPPVALATAADSVWVATQDGEVIQIRF